ncbi:MAG TPA: helix-hairpin-helix domain-containing protein, partial [Nitrospirales bacterium]|nr:helix-hairpin-helix domain-containing protein [Nitrospirales bacterium]
HIQGAETVASMVVWEEGQAKKSDYRKFRIKTVEGANDFASMTEVLRRRFTASEDGEVRWPRPDLLVIDGGIGQLTAALEGLRATKTAIPAIGLAKAKGDKEERIFVPNRKGALILPAGSPATHLLQRIRDEAHRFAVTYHRKLRGKALVASVLEEIPGIGDARKKRLLTHFVRLEDIARATDEQFKEAGIDAKTAGEIRKGLLSFT